jgi:hypothetical protein
LFSAIGRLTASDQKYKCIFLIKVIRNRTIIPRIAAIDNIFDENIFHINGVLTKVFNLSFAALRIAILQVHM